jgi:hypothetical protein
MLPTLFFYFPSQYGIFFTERRGAMSGKFVSFSQVQPDQYFRIDGQTWIKSSGSLSKEGCTYNSYMFSKELLCDTPKLTIDVKYFHDATLVKVEPSLPLYDGHIKQKAFEAFDNDN